MTGVQTCALPICHGTDALDLVGRNGDTHTSAADEQSAVGLALGDEADGGGGAGWVGRLVGGLVGADVNNFAHAGVRLKVFLDGILVCDAGFLYVGTLVSDLRKNGVASWGKGVCRTSQPIAIFHVGAIVKYACM